jgi:hypothetical protein
MEPTATTAAGPPVELDRNLRSGPAFRTKTTRRQHKARICQVFRRLSIYDALHHRTGPNRAATHPNTAMNRPEQLRDRHGFLREPEACFRVSGQTFPKVHSGQFRLGTAGIVGNDAYSDIDTGCGDMVLAKKQRTHGRRKNAVEGETLFVRGRYGRFRSYTCVGDPR